jgi:outer membrane protein assembly factor BamB
VSRAVPTSATWSFAAGASVRSSPVLANDGTIYFGSDDAYLYALNPNGSQKWRFLTGGAVESVPAVGADGTIYFGSDDNQVRALTPAGNLLWARSTGASVRSSPVAGPDGTVYVGSDDGYLYALNHATGAVLWRQNLGGLVRSSPALGAYGATIYVGSDDFKLRALTTATGTVKWVLATGGAVRSSPAIGPDGTIYFGSDDAFVYAVRDNGVAASLVWRQQTGGIVHSSPALGTDGTLYVGSDDTLLYALDSGATATTRVKWTFQTGGLVKGSPVVTSDGLILVPSLDHKLHLLSKNGTLAWSFDLGAEVWSSPAVVRDGTVIIGADSNKLVKVGTPALGIPVVAVSSRILRDRTTPLVVSATVPINALPVDPACPTCATFLTADVMILQQHTGVRMRSFSAPVVPVTSTGPITLSAVWDGKIVRSGVLIPAPDDAYLVGVAPVLARQPALTVEAPIPVTGPAYGAGPGDFGVTFAESFAPPQQFRVCMTYGCPDAPIIAQQTDSVCQLLHGADLGLPFVHSINGVLTHGMIFGDASPTAAGGVSTSNVPQYAISTTPVPTLGGLVGNDDIGALLGLQPPSTANLDAHVAPQCDIAPVFATDASGGIVPLSYIAPFGSGGTSGGAYMGPLFVPGPGFSLDFAPSRPRSLPRRREETRGIA